MPVFFSPVRIVLGIVLGLFPALALPAAALDREAKPAAAPAAITVAVSYIPPLVFQDADGHLQGLRIDMWRLWQAQTGIPVNFRLTNWTQAKDLLFAGKVDAIDVVSSTEAETQGLDMSAPYMSSNLTLYYHRGISGIVDARSSRGFLIGVRNGGSCVPALAAGGSTQLAYFANFEDMVAAALRGDIRVFCLPDQQAGYLLNRAGKADEFRHSPPLRTITLHWAVPRGHEALKNRIAAGFAAIPPATRKAVFDKWLGSSVPPTPAYLRHVIEAVLAVLTAFAVLLVWLWSLRRSVKRRTADLVAAKTALASRVREQACLHLVFRASEDLHKPVHTMLLDVASALRGCFDHPEDVAVDIEWDGQHHAQGDVSAVVMRIDTPLLAGGRLRGRVVVGCCRARPEMDASCLPEEERLLLDVVSKRLATVFERRALEDERRELDRQMFQMEKMTTMGELTMGLAHEIGNPLGGMKAVAQSLQHEEGLPAGVSEDLVRLEAEIDRLTRVLRSFHGYAAQQPVSPEACQLAPILDDVLFWTRRDAADRRIRFELGALDTLPPIRADRHQLKQVLLNLVMNAIQAMPEGGTITILGEPADKAVHLQIHDTGTGIPSELLDQVFEPFFTTRDTGNGLGLPIVRKIVEDHGGSIAIASEPGRGTCVRLSWPQAQEAS